MPASSSEFRRDVRRVSVNTINAAAATPPSPYRSWVDAPASPELPGRRVVIRGWCYRLDGQPIAAIRARVGARTFPGVYGDPRPDVRAMFDGPEESGKSGFEIAAIFRGRTDECFLEARQRDGTWETFQTFTISADVEPWGTTFRWTRFWAAAWLGRPTAWARLAAAERDFVVAWVRHRGWLNLQLAPQYQPRAVTPEMFPRRRRTRRGRPRLAVVTPSFQQAGFLEATIRSVLDQPDARIDYHVYDGGSTDGSVEIIRRYEHRLASWVSEPDGGQADAVQRGLAATSGAPDDLMMYLNSDDVLMPGAVAFVSDYFARHPEVDVVYGHRVLVDEQGREVGRWFSPRQRCDDLRLHDLIPQETLIWRRRIWDRVGGIDASFHFALDWDLLLRFAAGGARFARLPWFLGMFRLHDQQKSQAQLQDRGIPEMERLRLRTLGRPPSEEEMHLSMRRAQVDSALVHALWRRGCRV